MERLTFRAWRLAREISQEEIADAIGVHVNTYIGYEKNPQKVPFAKAVLICKALGCELDDVSFCTENLQNVEG